MAKKQVIEQKIKVKLFSPFQTYFQGEGVSVSAQNAVGPFDILPGHRHGLPAG
jgi:F0F1-type ATP synthase epsilon subunit